MTAEQKLINSQIRHALVTGALPFTVIDSPERDGRIRNLVYQIGVQIGCKFKVEKKGYGVWIIDIASGKVAKK